MLCSVSALEAKTAEEWYADAFEKSVNGKDDQALRSYQNALKLKPGWAEAHHAVAIVYSRLKSGPQAIHHLRRAEKIYEKISDVQSKRNLIIVRNNLKKAYARFDLNPEEFEEVESLHPVTGKGDWKPYGVGFLIGDNGYLLALYNDKAGTKELRVKYPNNTTASAKFVRRLVIYDLAIMKLEDGAKIPKRTLKLADTSKLRIGEKVFSADYAKLGKGKGAPKTLQGKITALDAIQKDTNILQMKLPHDPKHNGGPLFNSAGEVVGIVLSESHTTKLFESDGRPPRWTDRAQSLLP